MPKAQLEIPGTEGPKCKAIEQAADSYVEARDKRMRLTTKEVEAKRTLIDVCHANSEFLSPHPDKPGVMVHRFGDEIVELVPGKAKVKVRHAADEEDDDE